MAVTDRVEDMTLDTYVPGNEKSRCNYKMALQILKNEDIWRLAFFDFPAGDGFHVFHGMRHYWRNRYDVLAVHTNEFIEELIQSIQSRDNLNRDKFVNPQILLIDDVHFLMNKESTQYELYVLLKKRMEERKLTILFSPYGISQMRTYFRDDLIQLLALGIKEDLENGI